MNKAILIGRVTKDIELKTTASGKSVATFTLAVNRDYKNANGEYDADFINCVAWRNNAEFITKYFAKGQMIAIVGSLQQRSYEDKNGNKRTTYDVVVEQAKFCGSKQDKEPDVDFSNVDMTDEDLPF